MSGLRLELVSLSNAEIVESPKIKELEILNAIPKYRFYHDKRTWYDDISTIE